MAMLLKQQAIERRRRAKQRLRKQAAKVRNLDEMLALVDTPEGRKLALAEIHRHKGPIYGTDPADPGVIIEVRHDGTRRRGKFVKRRFRPFAK